MKLTSSALVKTTNAVTQLDNSPYSVHKSRAFQANLNIKRTAILGLDLVRYTTDG